jgi:outer membrane protein assembly complex protein YaeT
MRWALGLVAIVLLATAPARGEDGPASRAPLPASSSPEGEKAGERGTPRVAEVELQLPPGEDAAAARALVAVGVGDPLSARALRLTVQRLYQGGRFRNVIVRAAPAPPPAGSAGGTWVRVVIEAFPVRLLSTGTVRVEGAPAFDAEPLRAAAAFRTGDPFDDGDLEAAEARVRAALARRGYREARVEGKVLAPVPAGDRHVAAELRVIPGEPVRVVTLRLAGDPGQAAGRLAEELTTRAGAPLDEDVLQADVKRLRAGLYGAGYRRARVAAPRILVEGRSATVELPVEAGPRIAFLFRGNEAVPSAALQKELGFEEGLPVDAAAVGAAADRLAAFYRVRGYAAARIEPRELRRGRDLVVAFHVYEGRRYRLARISVEGLSHRDPRWLRERLAAFLDQDAPEDAAAADADEARVLTASIPGVRTAARPPPPLPPSATLDDAAWDRAAERLVDEWRADGFLETVYLGASVSLDAPRGVAETTLRFREGPRTHVEAISFEGNAAVGLPELARESRLAPGEPLAFEKVEATRAAILRIYLSRGYLYAHVEAREEVDRERHAVNVRFVVEEGPQVRVGRLVLSGNHRTREAVIRSQLTLGEGDVYDPDQIARSQARLLRLGVFSAVGLRLQEPELPQDRKDLSVELAERPWATLSQGVGFSIANGPRAFVEWLQPNIFGRALEFSARGKVNYPLVFFRPDLVGKPPSERIEGRADLGLRAPGLPWVSLPAGARANLIGEILHRKAYDLKRTAAVTGVDVGLTSRIASSLQYELEVDNIAKTDASAFLTNQDKDWLRFPEGVTTLHALRPSVALDYRDNSAHPQNGWYANAALEWAHSLGGKGERSLWILPGSEHHTNEVKFTGGASTYLPVRSTVLALALRGGRVFRLDSDSVTIVPRRFFMGGATTMRGYAEESMIQEDQRGPLATAAKACASNPPATACTDTGRQILGGQQPVSDGGMVFVLGKVELRVPLRGSLEGALFTDVGNLWSDPANARLQDLRVNVGFGLRFVTPIGPAVLDLGFNVTRDEVLNESLAAVHFTIGVF